MKIIKIIDKRKNKEKLEYIISKSYYDYYYRKLKKNQIKYKFKNSPEEYSIIGDFEENIIYNSNLDYVSMNPNFDDIYSEIFNILTLEKELEDISPEILLNKFRLINFQEINKEKIDKIKIKPVYFIDNLFDYKYVCYNKKIGLTLYTQNLLIRLFKKKQKCFYINMDYLYNEIDVNKIRNFIFFYLTSLFSIDEKKEYQDFIENNIINLIYMYKGEDLIKNLLVLLNDKFDNFTFYIDNVKSSLQFTLIKNFIDTYRADKILVLVQINQNTLEDLLKVQFILFDNIRIGPKFKDDLEYYIPISLG